jgi:hypothetical protein
MHQVADKLLRPAAKGELKTFIRTEEIGYHGKCAALDFGKEQGWTLPGNDTAMNLGDFQIRINLLIDNEQLSFLFEQVEITAQVIQGRIGHDLLFSFSMMRVMLVLEEQAMVFFFAEIALQDTREEIDK